MAEINITTPPAPGTVRVTAPAPPGAVTVTPPARPAAPAPQVRPPPGPPGPRGPQGPPGPAGGEALFVAAHALSGHRVVRLSPGGLTYPDLAVPSDAYTLIGVTPGAAEAGAQTAVVRNDVLEEPSWNWTPEALVFVGPAGVLTQTPPTSGWLCVVGVALSATRLAVGLQPPLQRVP